MIEQTILEYLMDALDMSDIYLEIPREIPETFIVFRVTDRGLYNQVNEATLEFYSYAPSKYEAAVLDELLRNAMNNVNSLPSVSGRFGGGDDGTDTTLKIPRYRCYYNLYY